MLAITNGKVMTISHGTLEGATLLIDEGRIAAVGIDVNIPADAQIIDATGKVVTPGLIDAHTHVGLGGDSVGRGNGDVNEMIDPVTPHVRALDAIDPRSPAFPA